MVGPGEQGCELDRLDGIGSAGVSAIVVSYNGRRYLDDCLRTVLEQLVPGDELIVVDNASTDDSPDLVRERYPEARLVRNTENRGFAAACNRGARLASGEVLVFLNQDTWVQPGWLWALIDCLQREETVGLTTSQVLMMSDPDRVHLCGQDVHFTGLVFGRGYAMRATSLQDACDVNAISGGSFAIRRKLWEKLGGFDETLYMYYEDTDLSWRAQMAGYRCRYAPASQVLHDYRPDSPSDSRLYYTFRNRWLLLLKNWRLPTLALLTPAFLVAEMLELGLALKVGRRGIRAKARSYGWIATHLGAVRRMRAAAQAGRTVSDAEILAKYLVILQPQEMPMRAVGNLCIAACNVLFALNYHIVHALCRLARL